METCNLKYNPERLKEWYDGIIDILDSYMDMDDEEKKIVALWSMSLHWKNMTPTIPFLFLNASKGSGKTRLLKILKEITNKSEMVPNLSDASLIRLPSQEGLNCLLIDEAERMTSKEKNNLRELCNQAYKKGGCVLRVEEGKDKQRIVKRFPVFLGICMANIWGLESVLEDRCITIILKKSNSPNITKLPEMFYLDPRIRLIKQLSLVYEVNVGSLVLSVGEYLFSSLLYHYHTLHSLYTIPTHSTHSTLSTLIEQPLLKEEFLHLPTHVDVIFESLKNSSLVARELELWMPLVITASLISKEFMEDIIKLAEKKSLEKKEFEVMEDRDTIFANFLGYYMKANGYELMIPVKKLHTDFVKIEGEKKWLSVEWIGKCLRRMGVIANKRRIARGIEVEISNPKLSEFLEKRGISIEDEKVEEYKIEIEKDKEDFQRKFTDYDDNEN